MPNVHESKKKLFFGLILNLLEMCSFFIPNNYWLSAFSGDSERLGVVLNEVAFSA